VRGGNYAAWVSGDISLGRGCDVVAGGYVGWFGQLGISLWREVHLRKHQVSGGGWTGVRSLFVVDYLAVYAT
jgi:hypothetical protein